MHLIEFFLQILDLFFNSLLPVDFLVAFLLRVPGLIVDMELLKVLIEDLFQRLTPGLFGVLGQKGITLLIADPQPGGHDRSDLSDIGPLISICAGQCPPLKLGSIIDHDLLEFFKPLGFVGGIQIFDVGFTGNRQFDGVIAVDRDFVKMNTAVGADDQIAPRIYLRNNTGDTDRIEAVLFQILPAVIGAQHHQDDFFSFKRRAPGHFLVCVNREKDVRIGNDNRVINGNNCHLVFLLLNYF